MMAASCQAQALGRTDLVIVESEPRILDMRLGVRLGFDRPRDVRKIIERNKKELLTYGEVCATVAQISDKGGRPSTEYLLNEAQALLICMFSRTEQAVEARREIVQVYLNWRKGLQGLRPASKFEQHRDHLSTIEDCLTTLERISPVVHQATYLPVWKNGRRPGFWSDLDVRAFLTRTHRQMTMKEARDALIDLYGPERTPSLSGINRYWKQLDQIAGLPPMPYLVWNRERA